MNLTAKELANRIKQVRKANNLSQKEMAEKMGINGSSYHKIESGATDINYSRLIQISEIFGTDIVKLLSK